MKTVFDTLGELLSSGLVIPTPGTIEWYKDGEIRVSDRDEITDYNDGYVIAAWAPHEWRNDKGEFISLSNRQIGAFGKSITVLVRQAYNIDGDLGEFFVVFEPKEYTQAVLDARAAIDAEIEKETKDVGNKGSN